MYQAHNSKSYCLGCLKYFNPSVNLNFNFWLIEVNLDVNVPFQWEYRFYLHR